MARRLFGDKPLPEQNADILSTGLLGTHFSETRIEILSFSFKKMHLKLSSAKKVAISSRRNELRQPTGPPSWYHEDTQCVQYKSIR